MRTYTYRINIVSLDRVQIEKRDAQDISLGESFGEFGYAEKRKAEIQELSRKAFADEITKTEIEQLGTALFEALFDQGLQSDLLNFYDEVVHRKDALLRIELGVDEAKLPDIAALPWEFLHVPSNHFTGEFWLAAAPKLIFSRRRALRKVPPPIQLHLNERLRIAVVVSAPEGDLGKVSYEKLWGELQELVTEQADRIELFGLVTPATREAIDRALEKKPHIFHFIGHGRLQDESGRAVGQIAVVRESGRERWVNAKQFSGLFTRHRPGIVLLQACEGAATAATQAFVGVASQIVQHNIPVVVAMQYKISNAAARRFAREFYKRLAEGDPVDKAAQEGRYRISDFHESRNFATPALFMQVRDGHLFERSTEDQLPESVEESPEPSKEAIKVAQRLSYMLDVATGSKERLEALIDFVKSTTWYGGDVDKFLDKMELVRHPTGYDLLRRYSANDKMELEIGGQAISFPQELISGDVQGKFEDVFIEFNEDTDYDEEPFRYIKSYKPTCTGLEERRKSRLKGGGRRLYNGKNLRLSNLEIVEAGGRSSIKTTHQPVFYFKGLGTNYSLDDRLPGGTTTLRDKMHGEGKLWPLNEAPMANPIGVNFLIISEESLIVLQHRDQKVAVRPLEACSSASGTVDTKDNLGKYHPILHAVYRETYEEIGLEADELGDIYFLGAVREFLRGGLPDFFFAAKTDLDKSKIIERANDSGLNQDKWEWESISDLRDTLPAALTQNRTRTFEIFLTRYIKMLSNLEQPPSLPLLTNIILLAKFQSSNPGILDIF